MSPTQKPPKHSANHVGDNSHNADRSKRVPTVIGVVALVASLPFAAVAFMTVTGIGLDQDLTIQLAVVGAVSIVVVPGLGIGSLLGGSAFAHGTSLALWSLVVLSALPGYFPGQRDTAVHIGVTYFTGSFPEKMQPAIRDQALSWVATLAGDRKPHHRALSNTDGPPIGLPPDALASDGARRDEPETTWIPYTGKGQSLLIPAHIDGANFGEELQFVFDTGATLTTLSQRALEVVDIPIPDDSPIVVLRTASGQLEAKLVLVEALWLKDELVEWVTVAVCEYCSSETADGLLGLNVSSHYRVSIDHENEEIEFVPRRGRRNRKLDIQPWLELNTVLTRWDDGRLELTVEADNRARQGIKSSVLEVRCANENFSVRLDPIPAHGHLEQPTSLPWGTDCERFEVQLMAAAWELDAG